MIKHILVDMDGVLCDWFDSAIKVWEDKKPENFPVGEEWKLADVLGISKKEFWERIENTPNFWENIEPLPWTEDLISYLNSLNIPWTIATSPNRDPKCATGKVLWLRKHINKNFQKYMIGEQKELMANPRTILLDDTAGKIKAFNNAGGIGILWPAPWNTLSHIKDPLTYVKDMVRIYTDDNCTSSC